MAKTFEFNASSSHDKYPVYYSISLAIFGNDLKKSPQALRICRLNAGY
jgi:hypothetical protein